MKISLADCSAILLEMNHVRGSNQSYLHKLDIGLSQCFALYLYVLLKQWITYIKNLPVFIKGALKFQAFQP